MFLSLSLIFLVGYVLGGIFHKIKLPKLVGMILTGIILGPYALNLIDGTILNLSSDLRKMALIIILIKAGLTLDINDLKKVGRPAILMSFVPATFEIIAMIIFAPKFFGLSVMESALLGAVIGAVSPAVVVPKMVNLIENGYGNKKSIPQLILAGASIDDIYVIVLFTSFTSLAQGNKIHPSDFIQIPISIVTGIIAGILLGFILSFVFNKLHIRDSAKIILIIGTSFFVTSVEILLSKYFNFSSLLAIITMSVIIKFKKSNVAGRLSAKFSKLWLIAEIVLFVLVGAAVDVTYVSKAGLATVAIIFISLAFRTIGVFICLIKTKLNFKERLFCAVSYLPKATVQAAIGSIPLALNLPCGKIVLTVAVMAILITAPLGAVLIDLSYKKLLKG